MKNVFLLFPLLIGLIPIHSQELMNKTDSIQKILESMVSENKTEKYTLYERMYDSIVADNLPGALIVAKQQHRFALADHNQKERGEAAGWIGYIYYMQGLNDSSLLFYNEALDIYNTTGDTLGRIDVMNNVANIFRITAQYDTAMVIYTDLLKYHEKNGNLQKQGKLLGNIGSLYYTAGNQEKAKEYTIKSLEIAKKNGGQ